MIQSGRSMVVLTGELSAHLEIQFTDFRIDPVFLDAEFILSAGFPGMNMIKD